MQAVALVGPGVTEVVDWPEPEPGPEDVVVDVEYCGFCGSDAHVISGRLGAQEFPRQLGHEVSGIVSEVGSAVVGVTPGTRVACNLYIECGHCYQCLAGRTNLCLNPFKTLAGYADKALYRPGQLFRVPDDVSLKVAAFLEPTATALHGIERGALKPGESVLIIGAGPLGLLGAMISRAMGAGFVAVSEVHPGRRAVAAGLDVDAVIDPMASPVAETAARLPGGGFDIVYDFSGSVRAVEAAVEGLGAGGRLVLVATFGQADELKLNANDLFIKEISIALSYTSVNAGVRSMALLPRLGVERIISRIAPLDGLGGVMAGHISGELAKSLVTPKAANLEV